MSTIDVVIFLVFISIVLLTSLSKKQFNTNFVAEERSEVSGMVLFAMVFGTLFTATSLFGTAGQVQLFGFSYFVIACSDVIRTLILCLFIHKIFAYKKYISVGEAIGSFYGRYARVIAGLCCLIFSTIIISIQFQWIYKTIDHLFNVDFNVGMLLAAFFVACYGFSQKNIFSIAGITRTLLLFLVSAGVLHVLCGVNQKLAIFSVIISSHAFSSIYSSKDKALNALLCYSFMILLLPIIFAEIESLDIPFDKAILSLARQVESVKLDLFDVKKLPIYSAIFLTTSIPIFNPLVIQRMRLAGSPEQARNIFILASIALFVFAHLVSLCAVASSSIYPEIASTNNFNSFLYLINNVVSTKVFKGVALCGILSVMFSTIEPAIITANSAILNDIVNNQIFFKSSLDRQNIMLTVCTIVVCATALLLGFFVENTTAWMMFAVNLWASVVTVPFMAGVFGVRGNSALFCLSAISGISINVVYYFTSYQPIKVIGVVASSLVINGLIFLVYYIFARQKNTR
jgi:Na+/proline symporter